jgi:hypothetical protein
VLTIFISDNNDTGMNEDEVEKVVLRTVRTMDSIKKVREFMFADIEKTLHLVDTPTGGPNFLLALGLCCYTEYWGKLLLGIKKNEKSEVPFNAFLYRLNGAYYQDLSDQLAKKGLSIYRNVRCGLAHAYLIEGGKTATIDTGNRGQHGIEYDFEKGMYIFWVKAYFDEFKNAVNSYVRGLEEGTEDLTKLKNALAKRPELV